jgi:hypothetical protein
VLTDLPVRQPLADQLQDPALLVGQRGQRILATRLVTQPGHHPGCAPRVQERLPRRHRTHGTDQVGAVDLLEHEPGRTRHHGVEEGIVVSERREHQAGDLGHL